MAIQVKVPVVGESIAEVTISNWTKKDGDVVKMDEVLAELESDKATFELPAPQAGRLRIVKPQGQTAKIGEVICEIEAADAPAKSSTPPASASTATPTHCSCGFS
jgi:2-oxoglutarate dehydrogenase E2 component (dihydrolipoamide succinyltransferase)